MNSRAQVKIFKRFFRADPAGFLIRKESTGKRYLKGDKVWGSPHSKGYRVLHFKNKRYFVHRVIFAVTYGFLPKMLDHINRKRADNRPENLRATDGFDNQLNRKLSKANRSGFSNLHFDGKYWRIQMRRHGLRYCGGRFKLKKEAIEELQKLNH